MKYTAQVQLTPKLHLGKLQYYWHIDQEIDGGTFTIRHGYNQHISYAFDEMLHASQKLIG